MSNFPHEEVVLLRPSSLLWLSGKVNHVTKNPQQQKPNKNTNNKKKPQTKNIEVVLKIKF